jgi:hypothetical protein
MERAMRIGVHLLAVVLIGGLSTGTSLAEDAAAHATDGVAPPSHHFGRPSPDREAKSKVNLHSAIGARPADKHGIAVQPTRNAVGLAVTPQNGNITRDSSPAASRTAGPGATVVVPISAGGGAVKVDSGVQHPVVMGHPNLSPAVTAPVAGSGAVNGTGFIHHGVAPAVVSGQTRIIAGISGSMVHPKH